MIKMNSNVTLVKHGVTRNIKQKFEETLKPWRRENKASISVDISAQPLVVKKKNTYIYIYIYIYFGGDT